jgi:CRISPR-associated protein GSU0053 (Cas_GSU0053)
MASDLLSVLRAGLSGDPSAARPAGIEVRQDLSPAGGLPVQPPAYEGRLEIHRRYVDGPGQSARDVIELDSVGSAANRLEEVLLELHRVGDYPLPVSSTTVEPADAPPIEITTLEAPHRVMDAWIRLSAAADGDGTFQDSEHGCELSMAHAGALDPLLSIAVLTDACAAGAIAIDGVSTDVLDWPLCCAAVGDHHGRGFPLPPVPGDGERARPFHVSAAGISGTASGDGFDGWLDGTLLLHGLDVRARYGPWGAAYLEGLLRLADRVVSRRGG